MIFMFYRAFSYIRIFCKFTVMYFWKFSMTFCILIFHESSSLISFGIIYLILIYSIAIGKDILL